MAKDKKIQVGKQSTRATFVPGSFNETERTVNVVFATDKPVLRYSYNTGAFYEVLDMAGHVTDRSAGSLPVLNDHNRWSGVTGIIARAENIKLEGGLWTATVRFSKRTEVDGIVQDVRDGIVQDLSVGYSVTQYEASPLADGEEIPTYIARAWESFEISFVVIPADTNAKVRGKDEQVTEIEIINPKQKPTIKNNEMKRDAIIAALKKRGINVPDDSTDEQLMEILERSIATPPAAKPAAPVITENSTDTEATRAAHLAEERIRTKEINETVRTARLPQELADEHIEKGTPIADVRKTVLRKIAERDAETGTQGSHSAGITVGTEEVEKFRTAVGMAIESRIDSAIKLDDGGRKYRNMSMLEIGKECLVRGGMNPATIQLLSKREIAQMALGLDNVRGYHSSSDLPAIFGNTINRTLRKAYDLATPSFTPFVNRGSINDFRPVTRTQLSQMVGGFDSIPEGGEYKYATLVDGKESYQLVKYGKMISYTWEMMINDDLNSLSRLPKAIANKAVQKQSDLVYDILLSNPLMGDGVALFASGRGNLAAVPSAIDSANVAIARSAMRKRKDINNQDFLNIQAKFLVVGPDKETEAKQLMNGLIVATKTSDTNMFNGYAEVIVEPRITGNQWFLIGDPNTVDTIEISFLDGEPDLFTQQRQGFDIDGIEIKARMVFATKAIDNVGMYKNAGN